MYNLKSVKGFFFLNVFYWTGEKGFDSNIPNVKFSRFTMAQNRASSCQMPGL